MLKTAYSHSVSNELNSNEIPRKLSATALVVPFGGCSGKVTFKGSQCEKPNVDKRKINESRRACIARPLSKFEVKKLNEPPDGNGIDVPRESSKTHV